MLTLYYFAITAAAVVFATWSEFGARRPDSARILFAYWIGLYWVGVEIALAGLGSDVVMRFEPAIDAAVGLLLVGSFVRRPSWWKAAVVGLLIVQLAAAVTYWLNDPPALRYAFRLTTNVLYHGILAAMVSSGVVHVIRGRARRRYVRLGAPVAGPGRFPGRPAG